MPTVYKDIEVEVDVDLDDFSDDELLDELEARGLGTEAKGTDAFELVEKIYQLRRLGKDYEYELDKLLYTVTGKVL